MWQFFYNVIILFSANMLVFFILHLYKNLSSDTKFKTLLYNKANMSYTQWVQRQAGAGSVVLISLEHSLLVAHMAHLCPDRSHVPSACGGQWEKRKTPLTHSIITVNKPLHLPVHSSLNALIASVCYSLFPFTATQEWIISAWESSQMNHSQQNCLLTLCFCWSPSLGGFLMSCTPPFCWENKSINKILHIPISVFDPTASGCVGMISPQINFPYHMFVVEFYARYRYTTK